MPGMNATTNQIKLDSESPKHTELPQRTDFQNFRHEEQLLGTRKILTTGILIVAGSYI